MNEIAFFVGQDLPELGDTRNQLLYLLLLIVVAEMAIFTHIPQVNL